jgi:hypothetical protein
MTAADGRAFAASTRTVGVADRLLLGCTMPDAVAGPTEQAFGTSLDGHSAGEIDIATSLNRASPPAAGGAPPQLRPPPA